MNKHFEVKQTVALEIAAKLLALGTATKHCQDDRQARLHHCTEGNVHSAYLVDTRHPSGMEVHVVLDNAEIHIFNVKSARRITVLFARPGQIRRYGIQDNMLLDLAFDNSNQGRNRY